MSHTFGQEKYTPNPDRYKADYVNMTQKDVDKLLKKTQKEKTREDAYRDLGLIYYYGNSNIPQDYAKAVEYLNKSFSFGKVIAASLYWKGATGVQKDQDKAFECVKNVEDSEILRQEKTFLDFGAQDLYYKRLAEVEKMVKEKLSHLTGDKWKYARDYVKYNSPSAIKCLLEVYSHGTKGYYQVPIPVIYNPFTKQNVIVEEPEKYNISAIKFISHTKDIEDGIRYNKLFPTWAKYLQKLLSNNPMNSVENAEDAYNQFKVGAITVNTFFNSIKTSSNQGEYAKYIPAVIFQSANANSMFFSYTGKQIFYDLAKDSLIDNNVINTLGIALCRVTNNPEYMFEIFKKLRLDGKFHCHLNESLNTLKELREYNWERNTNVNDIKPFAGCAFYPDGRIIFIADALYTPYNNQLYKNIDEICSNYRKLWTDHWLEANHFLVYDPNGQSMYGVLRIKGSKFNAELNPLQGIGFYGENESFKSTDEYDLVAGYYLSNTGERTREYYAGYNSPLDLIVAGNEAQKAAEKAEGKRISNTVENSNNKIEKALVQKYGRKAYDAMNNMRPYEGMPEGIVRDFRITTPVTIINTQVKTFNAYGFARIVSGYKLYLPTSFMKVFAQSNKIIYPKAIYVLNGKVAAVKW